jgi:Domain of unknown function (DUF4129)
VHSPRKACLLALLVGCGAAAQTSAPVVQKSAPAVQTSAAITGREAAAAVAALRRDPNLPGEKKIKSLRWVSSPVTPRSDPPRWLGALFDYLAQASSLLIWVGGGLGVGFAAIWIYRLVQARSPARKKANVATATVSVQGLDLSPGSLPEDIGAAAAALQAAGRVRDALSLLYRGALSRAVHRFGIVIGESYTEREALRAVKDGLEAARSQYFSDLVELWQRAVYAGEMASPDSVSRLCSGFSPALDRAAI